MAELELKRLHAVIPGDLFSKLQATGLLKEIDGVVTRLLRDEIKRLEEEGSAGKVTKRQKKIKGAS